MVLCHPSQLVIPSSSDHMFMLFFSIHGLCWKMSMGAICANSTGSRPCSLLAQVIKSSPSRLLLTHVTSAIFLGWSLGCLFALSTKFAIVLAIFVSKLVNPHSNRRSSNGIRYSFLQSYLEFAIAHSTLRFPANFLTLQSVCAPK